MGKKKIRTRSIFYASADEVPWKLYIGLTDLFQFTSLNFS